MDEEPKELAHKVALFRYGLIADLVHLEPGQGLYKKMRDKASRTYPIPGTHRSRVAAETIRGWLRAYKKGGFDALVPKPRSDIGKSRSIPGQVADLLLCLKEDHLDFTLEQLIGAAREAGVGDEVPLAHSTVHRLLERHGLAGRRRPDAPAADRRKFAFERAGQLWMGDVMHGPKVHEGKRRRRAYLVAFLDDATRVVPYAAFALHENTTALLRVFKQALLRRGIPERLYVDNGSAFRSHHLGLVCAKLGVALVHGRPYRPQGKGKIERWFRTVRTQLLRCLGSEDTMSLEALNRRLWGWVEGEYHHAPHRGLGGQSPLDRWAQSATSVRTAAHLDLDELFLDEAKRRVHADRTVSLHGRAYEVDAVLVRKTVVLRFDPERPKAPVQVWHDGQRYADAPTVDAYANCFVKRNDAHRRSLDVSEPHRVQPPPMRLSALTDNDDEGGR